MKKTVFLHIGTHKTGSTSVQHFLHDNTDRLRSHGFLYPSSHLLECAHHRFGTTLLRDAGLSILKNDASSGAQSYSQAEPVALADLRLWPDLKEEVEQTDCSYVIISSEEFEWVTQPEVIPRLLGNHNYKIVVCLRRQDHYLESVYQTFVKNKNVRLKAEPAKWIGKVVSGTGFHDYFNLLERWAAVFGKENILPIVFEDAIINRLEVEFLRTIGVDDAAAHDFVLPEESWLLEQRKSLDNRCLEFLRLCNQQSLDAKKHEAIVAALMLVSDAFRERRSYNKDILDVKQRSIILDSVRDSNQKLLKKYFPGRQRMFPELDLSQELDPIVIKRVVPLFMRFYEQG